AQLNNNLTVLRIARLQYMLANGVSESTKRLDQKLDINLAQQTKLLNTFKNPVNVAMFKEQAGYNELYQRSLNDMRQGYARANGAKQTINDAAGQLDELTARMSSQVVRAAEDDGQRFAITQIKEELKQSQYLLQA